MRLLSVVLLLCSLPALARPNGIAGYSGLTAATCVSCHGGNAPSPTVQLLGPASLSAGATASYTVKLTGGPGVKAGVDVAAGGVNSGQVVLTAGPGTKLVNRDVVHMSPLAFTQGAAAFTFSVKAPLTAGPFTLFATGLSANGTGNDSGDGTGKTSLQVEVVLSPQPDAGPPPAADAGTPAHDAGTAVHDAGSPLPAADAGVMPSPDAGAPTLQPDAGAFVGLPDPGLPPAPEAGADAGATAAIPRWQTPVGPANGGCTAGLGAPWLALAALALRRRR